MESWKANAGYKTLAEGSCLISTICIMKDLKCSTYGHQASEYILPRMNCRIITYDYYELWKKINVRVLLMYKLFSFWTYNKFQKNLETGI